MSRPTSANPRRNHVTLRFTDDEFDALNTAATRAGLSRSDWLRRAATRVLGAKKTGVQP